MDRPAFTLGIEERFPEPIRADLHPLVDCILDGAECGPPLDQTDTLCLS